MASEVAPLYKEVAERISFLIGEGVLKPRQRIPSIRTLAQQLGVSMGTVKEAYWLLERKRLIEAQPQSGFFVRDKIPEFVSKELEQDPRNFDPQEVSLCRIYGIFQTKFGNASELGLSMAIPGRALQPTEKLARCFQEVLRDSPEAALNYSMSPGFLGFREHLALQSLSSGLKARPDDFIVCNGCHEAMYLALSVVCSPGDLVVVESPLYFNMITMLEHLRLRILEVPCGAEGLDLGVLEFALDHHEVKAVLTVPSFSNPTGSLMSNANKERLVKMLATRDIPLIEDDIYGDVYFGNERPRSCASYDSEGGVILCSSFSKSVAPGLRLGWVRGGRWQDSIDRHKSILNIGTASYTQMAVARYLDEDSYERHLRFLRTRIREQMELIRAKVLEHFPQPSAVNEPQGGLVFWVELPDGIDSLELYQKALAQGIMIAPGALFSMTGRWNHHIRLNAGIWNEGTAQAIKKVGEICKTLLTS